MAIFRLLSGLSWFLAMGLSAHADSLSGTGYALGSNHGTTLFTFKREETIAGHTVTSHTKFSDPQGALIVDELVVAENDGSRVVNYVMDRKQTGEVGRLVVSNGKAVISWTKDGKTETDSEDAKPNLILGPSTVPYLQARWAALMKGDDIDTRYVSLDRKETVGFKFFKIGESKRDGQDTVQIKMKPSSFVIAALVNPLIFTFDKSGKRLLELEGRALPKQQVDGKWKDLDADMVYRYAP